MPVGGALKLKGGQRVTKDGVVKKKKKQKKAEEGGEQQQIDPGTGEKKIDPAMVDIQSGGTYEKSFQFEMQRSKEGKTRSTPWGSTYRAAPEILHGYTKKVKGKTASERLDMRSACKTDKFCK